jgi:hypothetical protein
MGAIRLGPAEAAAKAAAAWSFIEMAPPPPPPRKGCDWKALKAPKGKLAVMCWCEADVVYVTPAELRAGRTGSCNRLGCE